MSDRNFCIMCNTVRMLIIAGAFVGGCIAHWWDPFWFWIAVIVYMWVRVECNNPQVYEDE